MGWTDIFKSKSSKAKADPRVRWFGKLPTYGDYYRSRGEDDWSEEFHALILKGFEFYQSRAPGGTRHARLPISTAVIRLPESDMTAFASVLDYGGDNRGRPFPMLFYVGVPTAQWPGPTSGQMVAAGRVLRELLGLKREVSHFLNSPGRFEQTFDDRTVELAGLAADDTDESWRKALSAVSLADWFSGVPCGLNGADARQWRRAVAAWGDAIAAHESKSFEPTLCFPLSSAAPFDGQAAGWIRWLDNRIDLRRRTCSLIVTGEGAATPNPAAPGQVRTPQPGSAPGRLCVVARDLIPDDFLLFTPLAATLPYVEDPAAKPAPPDAANGPQSDANAPNSPREPATWIEFVEALPSLPRA